MSPDSLWLFIAVSALISVTPGPVMLAAMVQGARVGVARAHWGMLGATCGHLILMSIAVSGISWLAQRAPAWFVALQWLGAAYLCWLGLKTFALSQRSAPVYSAHSVPMKHLFLQALAVSCSNPKGIVYFASILPPFVDAQRPLIPQLLLLTAIFALIDYIWMLVYASAGQVLVQRFTHLWPWFNKLAGAVFIAVGVWLFYHSL